MKKKLAASILLLILSTVSLLTVVHGWFTEGSTFRDFVVTTGFVSSEAKIYYIEDFDRDGNPDIVNGGYVATPITAPNIVNMKPGDVYGYRIDIKNTGTITGDLTVYFEGLDSYAAVLTVEGRVEDTSGNVLSEGEKTAAQNGAVFATADGILPAREISPEPDVQIRVFFSLKFETLDYLKTAYPETFGALYNLNDYKNISFENLKIAVKLTQHTGNP